MKLYVRNATRQAQRVMYRLDVFARGTLLPGNGKIPANAVDLAPGQQKVVGGDLEHLSQAEAIIKQLRIFGAVDATEANRLPNAKVAYIYSVGSPVADKVFTKVFMHNQAIMSREGKARRETAAIAAASVLDTTEASISFEQLDDGGVDKSPMVAEGYRVDKAADAAVIAAKGGNASRVKPSKRPRV